MRIGIVGAGMIGLTVAKLWADAGHDVRLASRHPDDLTGLVARIGSHASAGTPADAATFGDVVVLTVPLKAVPSLGHALAAILAGKIVVDTGNAYEQRDGDTAREATAHPSGSAAWAAGFFPGARWVKAFNTVYFKVLETDAHKKGDRVGIPLASDDAQAMEVVAQLVRDAGLDPVSVGGLARGREFELGTPPYNTGKSGPELRALWHLGR